MSTKVTRMEFVWTTNTGSGAIQFFHTGTPNPINMRGVSGANFNAIVTLWSLGKEVYAKDLGAGKWQFQTTP